MRKPKAKSIAPDHIAVAHAQLVRAEALLEALAYCLKYADSDKEVDPGGVLDARRHGARASRKRR